MRALQLVGREALRQGGVSKLCLGPMLFAVVADPLDAEFVTKSCLEKPDIVKPFRMFVGNGSLLAPVSIWRPRRRVMAPLFGIKSLKSFVPTFSRLSRDMAARLRQVPEKTDFSVWEHFTAYSIAAICGNTLDYQLNIENEGIRKFLTAFEEVTAAGALKIMSPWYYFDTISNLTPLYKKTVRNCEYVKDFISKIIESKREEFKNKVTLNTGSQYEPVSFLEQLFTAAAEGRGFSATELREEVAVLLLAATDTSAVLTAFATLMLATHPRVQDKLCQELESVFGDSDRPVQADDLHQLPYLEAVLKETLRLYPSVPVIVRDVEKDVTLPSGLTLKNDCSVMIHIWGLHRHPSYWGRDAEQFRPERFLEGWPSHAAAFMGFSYGPRGCIGHLYAIMSLKTLLASLLREYRLLPAESADGGPLRLKYGIMMRHVDNYVVQIKRKKKVQIK